MKYLNWNPEKNEILKKDRGISFEEIAYFMESGRVIGIEENPGHPNQKMKDYHQIQIKAIEEGIPYQTLISSLVHKYLNGSLTHGS